MNQRPVQVGVVVALVAGLVVAALVLRGRHRLPETPEAAVTALFDAASRGDDEAYLRLVAGDLRTSLGQRRAELGKEGFRESLRRSARGINGLAVTRSPDAPSGLVAVDVEIVFDDHNERQRMLLAPAGSGWAITAIHAASLVKPDIPYGTPVYEEEAGKGIPSGKQP